MLSPQSAEGPAWTFLTNHAHVLICIARDPGIRTRDLAVLIGITERAVQRIIADLVAEQYLIRERHGRRNRYVVRHTLHLRHPIEAQRRVIDLLALVGDVIPQCSG